MILRVKSLRDFGQSFIIGVNTLAPVPQNPAKSVNHLYMKRVLNHLPHIRLANSRTDFLNIEHFFCWFCYDKYYQVI